MKNVGVYSVQGDVAENIAALKAASSNGLVKCSINEVITAEQIMNLDALVIPGGESTVMGGAGFEDGALRAIKEKSGSGMPILGKASRNAVAVSTESGYPTKTTIKPILQKANAQASSVASSSKYESK